MKKFLLLFLLLAGTRGMAVSICQNNVCGQIVCSHGCVQQAVNGVCVRNECVGRRLGLTDDDQASLSAILGNVESSDLDDASSARAARCVSCAGRCCRGGHNFLSAERACKAACGSFGCFTRC